ncbi:MAG: hypothetical protein IKA44_04295 [Clostridia bacterium]|nr:hypothetical protein [Clostridia bacterium]
MNIMFILIPCIACLIIAIVGVFIAKKQNTKSNEKYVASENATFTHIVTATSQKPSPTAFVIWLIATIVLLGGAITLGIFTLLWGDDYQYYKEECEEIKSKMSLEQPFDEFEEFIAACKSEEVEDGVDLAPYWNNYVYAMEQRGFDYLRSSNWAMESSSYYLDWYDVQDIAKSTGFMKDKYDEYGGLVSANATDAAYANAFENELLKKLNNVIHQNLTKELAAKEEYTGEVLLITIVAFFIPCVICLALGIVGIFVTIKQRKKLKEWRVAYESAIQERATAENLEKQQYLLKLEEMQRRIDTLEGKAPTEVTSQSTMQASPKRAEDFLRTTSSSQQDTSAPTSSNGPKPIEQSSAFTPHIDVKKRTLLQTLSDIEKDKEGIVKFLLAVAFFPLKTILRTIALPNTCSTLVKADTMAKEIAAKGNAYLAEGYENVRRREAREAYEKANTTQEKMEFFYCYFSSVENCKKPTLCAYIMTYIAENSSLFDKNDPLHLASYFADDVDNALYSLLGFDPQETTNGRHYEHLLRVNDGERGSDKYILQCLIIAANGSEGDSVPLYKYDILGQECMSEDAE